MIFVLMGMLPPIRPMLLEQNTRIFQNPLRNFVLSQKRRRRNSCQGRIIPTLLGVGTDYPLYLCRLEERLQQRRTELQKREKEVSGSHFAMH